MRPMLVPSMSNTLVPRRSSTLISIACTSVSAPWNVSDDVTRDPDLPRNRPSLLCFDVELDVAADCLYARPGNPHRPRSLGPPLTGKSYRHSLERGMQPGPKGGAAD